MVSDNYGSVIIENMINEYEVVEEQLQAIMVAVRQGRWICAQTTWKRGTATSESHAAEDVGILIIILVCQKRVDHAAQS